MECDLESTVAMLRLGPAAFDALLRELPEGWAFRNEGIDTWNAAEILGHLAHGERTDWMPRVNHLLRFGEETPFDPFDRLGQRRSMEGKTLTQLLDEFAQERAGSLEELQALRLSAGDLERRGRHPALGSVTLGQLLTAWAVHDLTHLHQTTRVLAYQHRHSVGPFEQYLGVLHCSGHGAPA
jgi:hypothetical protein